MPKCLNFAINAIPPFLTCFVRPLQELNGVNYKLDAPPLSLSGFSPTTQIGTILYKIIRRSRGRQSALA